MSTFKKCIAELIGTAMLVVFGCGTAVVVGCDAASGSGYLLTALAFGMVVTCMVYAIGDVSGCHINPAISLAVLVKKGMSFSDFVLYVTSQVIGAIAGAGILKLVFHFADFKKCNDTYGSNGLAGVNGDVVAGLLVEIILTFLFVWVVLSVTSKSSKTGAFTGLIVGLSLTLVHILGIGLTGTSVNPARSFGPALLSAIEAKTDALKDVWVFVVGPCIGAVLAAFASKLSDKKETSDK